MKSPKSSLRTNKLTGFLLVNKPQNLTSHDLVHQIRQITKVKKVGHTGTLDPLATGLLIILVGQDYTKKQSQFLKQDKQYQVTARLGLTTNTYDSQGQITSRLPYSQTKSLTLKDIARALKKYQGKIKQTVPPFSAVKVNGQKLYHLARKNKLATIKLPQKTIFIHKIKILNFINQSPHPVLKLQIDCSSGTYIRSLIHDLGQTLKTGATVTKLQRTKIGDISLKQAVNLEELTTLKNLKKHLLAKISPIGV